MQYVEGVKGAHLPSQMKRALRAAWEKLQSVKSQLNDLLVKVADDPLKTQQLQLFLREDESGATARQTYIEESQVRSKKVQNVFITFVKLTFTSYDPYSSYIPSTSIFT